MSKKKIKSDKQISDHAQQIRMIRVLPEPVASQQLGKYHESREESRDRCYCKCGNDSFRVYITIIIDDARLYCDKCNREHGL